MPSDKFPSNEPKEVELTTEQLESLLLVNIDPEIKEEDLLIQFRSGKSCRFIVDDKKNIFLTYKNHKDILYRLGKEFDSVWIPDGVFKYKKDRVDFSYHFNSHMETPKHKYLYEAVENKITAYIKAKNLK